MNTTMTKTSAKVDRGNKNATSFVIESRVREWLHDKGVRLGEDTIDSINVRVENILTTAVERMDANNRKTLYNYDI